MTGSAQAGRGRVVVVGAGVAGLTAAERLVARGFDVTVLERENQPGGLCRSFRYDRFVFDIGPHRLHTYDDRVQDYFGEVLRGELHEIDRASAVHMFDRTMRWPLGAGAAIRIPPLTFLRILGETLLLRRSGGEGSFEDYIRSRYGPTLYETFFRPYTERFTGLSCRELDSAWARTSIERALIDRGLSAASLPAMALSALRPARRLRMYYPAAGGIGSFPRRLAERAAAGGGSILTGRAVSGLEVRGGRVAGVRTASGTHGCDLLVWTAPLTTLCAMLESPVQGLPFLGLLLYNLQVSGPPGADWQWCYYSAPEIPFSRVSIPVRFHPGTAPDGAHGLCVEVPMPAGDRRWRDPERLAPAVCDAAGKVGLLGPGREIAAVRVEQVPEAYPLYTTGYRDRLSAARQYVSRFGNVHLLGRSASFWYNNIDGSVAAALSLADRIGGRIA